MNYSAFEQAAAEASRGMQEVETQLEQLKAQIGQLQSKKDLLSTLSSQLLSVRPAGGTPPDFIRPAIADMPKPEQSHAESEAEPAAAGRSLRQGWSSLGSDPGTNGSSGDSTFRGRL